MKLTLRHLVRRDDPVDFLRHIHILKILLGQIYIHEDILRELFPVIPDVPAHLFQNVKIQTVHFTGFLQIRNIVSRGDHIFLRIEPAAQSLIPTGNAAQ